MDLFIGIRNKNGKIIKLAGNYPWETAQKNEEHFWSGVMGGENLCPSCESCTPEQPLKPHWTQFLRQQEFPWALCSPWIFSSIVPFAFYKENFWSTSPFELTLHVTLGPPQPGETAAFWLTCHCLFPLEKSLQIRVCKLSLQQFKTDNWIMCAMDSLVGKEFTPQHILDAERAPVSVTLLAAVLTVKELPLYSSTVIKFLQRPWLINQIFIHLCKYMLNREYPQSWASQHKCSFMWPWQSPENMRSCFAFLMPRVLRSAPVPKNRTQVILLMASVTQPQLKLLHYGFIPSF